MKALWPIFGIANQLLASIALCLATTILLKMQLQRGKSPALALVAFVPLVWLLAVTLDASVIKIWDPSPKIGFFAGVHVAEAKLSALATSAQDPEAIAKAAKALATQRFNGIVDAWVTGTFLFLVSAIVLLCIVEWVRLLTRSKASQLSETEPVFLPGGVVNESNPLPAFGLAMLGFTLLKELSGEAAIDRAEKCACAQTEAANPMPTTKSRRQNAFLTAAEDRYRGVNRCC